MPLLEITVPALNVVWFPLIIILWVDFFFLEGLDFGVTMLLPVFDRNDKECHAMVNTIGPIRDGNEMWLLTASGAAFAAFPGRYTVLFFGLYLSLSLVLVGPTLRGAAFEYHSKYPNAKWYNISDAFATYRLLTAILVLGVGFANFTVGLANDEKLQNGSSFGSFGPFALLGGVLFVALPMVHDAIFLALKSCGEVHDRARGFVRTWGWPIVGLLVVFVVYQHVFWPIASEFRNFTALGWITATVVVVALAASVFMTAHREWEGWSFVLDDLSVLAMVVGLFVWMHDNLGSAQDESQPMAIRLNIVIAAGFEATLTIMTWAAVIFVPIVLAHQTWSYWVFSRRISTKNVLDKTVY